MSQRGLCLFRVERSNLNGTPRRVLEAVPMNLDAFIGASIFVIGVAALLIDMAWEASLARPSRGLIGDRERADARRTMVYTLMGAHSGGPYPKP
jgi:hypothetical protein